MSMMGMAAPILPGKKEQWERFINRIRESWRTEFDASRQRAGVRERTFLQQTPDGSELVIVTLEGTGTGIIRFANGKDVEHRVNFDALGLLQQVGVIPTPEQVTA